MQIKPMIATFLASALWHGCLELGFWVMFIGLIGQEYFYRVGARTRLAHWISDNVPFACYWPLFWIWQYFQTGYLQIAFQFLQFEKFNYVHKNLYYFQHWFVPLVSIIVTLLPKVKS